MFNDIIVKHFTEPTFAAEIDDPTRTIELGNPVCGDRIRVQLKEEGNRVAVARYQAWGCATSLATGNIFCTHIQNRPFSDLLATEQSVIDSMLGELDPAQYHCLEMLRTLFDELRAPMRVETAGSAT
jgi:NifU-like protein involved in Fe-S cluster formation